MMGDPLGSSRLSSQKQNCEGVAGAQSGQYRATAKSSLGCGWGPEPGCDILRDEINLCVTKYFVAQGILFLFYNFYYFNLIIVIVCTTKYLVVQDFSNIYFFNLI